MNDDVKRWALIGAVCVPPADRGGYGRLPGLQRMGAKNGGRGRTRAGGAKPQGCHRRGRG